MARLPVHQVDDKKMRKNDLQEIPFNFEAIVRGKVAMSVRQQREAVPRVECVVRAKARQARFDIVVLTQWEATSIGDDGCQVTDLAALVAGGAALEQLHSIALVAANRRHCTLVRERQTLPR